MFKKLFVCMFLIMTNLVFAYSEQVVVGQFDIGLKKSTSNNKYSLTGVTGSGIVSVGSTDLSTVIDFKGSEGKSFTGSQNDLKYNYDTAEKSIIIPVTRNSSTISAISGSFQLTESSTISNETLTTYLIQNKIILPAKSITLSQDTTVNTGVKFTYNDMAKTSHLQSYKKQNFVVRIAKASITDTNYDVLDMKNGIKLANSSTNAKSFLDGDLSYVDFLVTADEYDKAQSVNTNVGLNLKFMPGNIEVFGLPKGDYRLELYSFRYSNEVTTKGNVVITKENWSNFNIGNTEFLQDGIEIMNFSSTDFPKVDATILTIGITTTPALTVSEDNVGMGATISSTSGSIYIDSTSTGALSIATNGTLHSGKYYQLWNVVYNSSNTAVNTNERTVRYKMNGTYEASTIYKVISSGAQYTSPLYQTVFVGFKNSDYTNGEYEIDDRVMNKYSNGYRSTRTADVPLTSGAIDVEKLYRGVNSTNAILNTSYNWRMNQPTHNSLIISKSISDSKGILRKIGNTSNSITFYTTEWEANLTYVNDSEKTNQDDTIAIKWNSPKKTSYDATLSQDKTIFRIIKSTGNTGDTENYRYKPDLNLNLIKESTEDRLVKFMSGTSGYEYFDIVFSSGEDSRQSYGNVIFNYFKNNSLKIVGLDAGDYKIHIYSLQEEDTIAGEDSSYDYKVLTFGGPLKIKNTNDEYVEDDFTMKEPIVPSLSYTIDSVEYNKDTSKVEVGLIINADQLVTLNKDNLIAKKSEIEDVNSKFYYSSPSALMVEAWNPAYNGSTGTIYTNVKEVDPTLISVEKSLKEDFQYPLDIVFLIDNSASMQNEIDGVKKGLDNFSSGLTARGYNVKFNLITFGANQKSEQKSYNDGVIGYPINPNYSGYSQIDFSKYNWLAIFNKNTGWFSDKDDLKNALDNLQGIGGAQGGQENGSYALHYGIEHLKKNGRYLNKSYDIVGPNVTESEKYKPSKKWIIFLTDENMDTQYVPTGYSNSNNIIKEFSNKLEISDINLTGIFHTSFVSVSDADAKYNELSISKGKKEFWTFRNTFFEVYKDEVGYYILYNREGNKQYLGKNTDGSNLLKANEALDKTKTYYIKDVTSLSATPSYTGGGQVNNIKYLGERYIYDFFGGNGSRPQDFGDVFYTDFALKSNWTNSEKAKLFNMYDMGVNGENTESSLVKSIKDIGIIQRWTIKYTSPFAEEEEKKNDGQAREVIFSLNKVKSVESTSSTSIYVDLKPYDISSGVVASDGGIELGSRNYVVPMEKIAVEFINPSKTNRRLEKANGLISLRAKAQSQYKEEISGSLQWVNYAIIRGTFVITGNYSNDGITAGKAETHTVTSDGSGTEAVILNETTINSSIWYEATSTLNEKTITDKFGKNPMNINIKFIAETESSSKSETLSGVTLVDKTAPKIRSFTIKNKTLNTFMDSLTNLDNSKLYSSTEINSATIGNINNSEGIKASDFETTSGSKISLDAKVSDKIKVQLTIEDESITSTSAGATVVYNGISYPLSYVSTNNTNSNITYWEVEIDSFAYVSGVNNISINVTDSSLSPNNTTITGSVFEEPVLIKGTTLKSRSDVSTDSDYNIAGLSFNNYYNNRDITTTDKNNEALAYLMVFTPHTTEKDSGSTNIITYPTLSSQYYQLSKDGNFKFGDGRYQYSEVFVINKAGGIARVNEPLTEVTYDGSLGGVVTTLNAITKEREFFVDTVRPDIRYVSLDKISDNNLSSFLGGNSLASGILLGPTSSTRPYKVGDGIELKTTLAEYNFLKSTLSQIGSLDIMTGMRVYAGSTELIANSVTGAEERSVGISEHFSGGAGEYYTKRGTASDLSSGNVSVTGTLEFNVYDKAGNISVANVSVNYDDTIPNNISVASRVSGGGFKYTDNVELPLNNRTGTNYSVGLLVSAGQNYVGDIRAASTVNLTSFSNNLSATYSPVINSHNIFNLRAFSKSGMVSAIQEDHIILDKAVNDNKTSITETVYSYSDNTYRVNLTNSLSSINELVGLSRYRISTEAGNIKLNNGTLNETISSSGLEVDLSTLSGYNNSPNSTAYTSINTIVLPSSGKTKYKIILTDRLGNSKTIDYIIEIPNNVKIIGKTSGSTKQIETKINNASNKVKVESRKE